jgi:hypothetical protein
MSIRESQEIKAKFAALEQELAQLRERVAQLEAKPRAGRPPKEAQAA